MLKAKPILFSTPMVQAIQDKRKTMTRRVITLPEGMTGKPVGEAGNSNNPLGLMYIGGIIRSKYQPGDVLWVRETWCKLWHLDHNDQIIEGTESFYYAADGYNPTPFNHFPDADGFCGDRCCPRWRPSIFMPRDAARIFLQVTDVKTERLQDISEFDAKREGCMPCIGLSACGGGCESCEADHPIDWFHRLWDSINAARGHGWDKNEWVWAYTFKQIERPEGWPGEGK